MSDKLKEKPDYSHISTFFLAGVAEQGLPMDSNDPDAIMVNAELFDRTNQPSILEEIYVA